jgi:RimJ/RimL family protein N-acetyltransferase
VDGAVEQPVGDPVEWAPVASPRRAKLRGRYVLLRPVDPAVDTEPLYAVSHPPDGDPSVWTYIPHGPYAEVADFRRTLEAQALSADPLYFTLARLPCERPEGIAAYMRIKPEFGVIEIGHIWFGPPLQRTTAATEAIYLLARNAFDELGYRRFEWKCDALNAPSRHAAERFGFEFEGVFAQHMVVKGRNRDTAWFAITDQRWPGVRAAFEAWLAPSNFDAEGRQLQRLEALRTPSPDG